jgi:hypothetical protein
LAEWLLAEENISVNGHERRVSEMLLGQSGLQFSAPERQYLELLAAAPLRVYEVVGVTPGTSMSLKDMLLPEREPVLVMEKAGSELLVKFDLLGTRILSVDSNCILSGAMLSDSSGTWPGADWKVKEGTAWFGPGFSSSQANPKRDHFELLAQAIYPISDASYC